MTTLLLQCPHCGTELETSERAVEDSDGWLRCGDCLKPFSASGEDTAFVAPRLDEGAAERALASMTVQPIDGEPAAQPGASRTSRFWLAMIGLLTILLGWQVNESLREPAAAKPAVTLGKILVRPHPVRADALRVDAILHNSSAAEQPLPAIELNFQDSYGQTRAGRRFRASEYLQGDLGGRRSLPGHSEFQVTLELADPGKGTVNYTARLISADRLTD
jgi:hypothetical protein